tara:strand:+ start:1426 stop:1791 length:366 start_codon:yes stop_codon:yes gene_type:complete
MATYKEKFNKKYGQPKDQSNSLAKIAKLTGRSKAGLQKIFNKGIGAFKTNRGAVRPNVKSPEQWAYARVYSAVMGGKAAKVDKNELAMGKKKSKPNTKDAVSNKSKPKKKSKSPRRNNKTK